MGEEDLTVVEEDAEDTAEEEEAGVILAEEDVGKNKMTNTSLGNVCTRCGKERVVTKVYKEKTDSGYIYYKVTACSDPACQKIVDRKLADEANKRAVIKREQVKREGERQKNMAKRRREASE